MNNQDLHNYYCNQSCATLCFYRKIIRNNPDLCKKICYFLSLDIPQDIKVLVIRKLRETINIIEKKRRQEILKELEIEKKRLALITRELIRAYIHNLQ